MYIFSWNSSYSVLLQQEWLIAWTFDFQLLTIAVLVIIITAPIGAIAISLSAPRLLQKAPQKRPETEENNIEDVPNEVTQFIWGADGGYANQCSNLSNAVHANHVHVNSLRLYETKWLPFCSRLFQINFLLWKLLDFDSNFSEISSQDWVSLTIIQHWFR